MNFNYDWSNYNKRVHSDKGRKLECISEENPRARSLERWDARPIGHQWHNLVPRSHSVTGNVSSHFQWQSEIWVRDYQWHWWPIGQPNSKGVISSRSPMVIYVTKTILSIVSKKGILKLPIKPSFRRTIIRATNKIGLAIVKGPPVTWMVSPTQLQISL